MSGGLGCLPGMQRAAQRDAATKTCLLRAQLSHAFVCIKARLQHSLHRQSQHWQSQISTPLSFLSRAYTHLRDYNFGDLPKLVVSRPHFVMYGIRQAKQSQIKCTYATGRATNASWRHNLLTVHSTGSQNCCIQTARAETAPTLHATW